MGQPATTPHLWPRRDERQHTARHTNIHTPAHGPGAEKQKGGHAPRGQDGVQNVLCLRELLAVHGREGLGRGRTLCFALLRAGHEHGVVVLDEGGGGAGLHTGGNRRALLVRVWGHVRVSVRVCQCVILVSAYTYRCLGKYSYIVKNNNGKTRP